MATNNEGGIKHQAILLFHFSQSFYYFSYSISLLYSKNNRKERCGPVKTPTTRLTTYYTTAYKVIIGERFRERSKIGKRKAKGKRMITIIDIIYTNYILQTQGMLHKSGSLSVCRCLLSVLYASSFYPTQEKSKRSSSDTSKNQQKCTSSRIFPAGIGIKRSPHICTFI